MVKTLVLGFKKNVYKYIAISDCLICSSLWEDPGFVIIEAGILNKIIISSDCPNGPRELLKNNNGYLFENNNQLSLIKEFDKYKNNSLKINQSKVQSRVTSAVDIQVSLRPKLISAADGINSFL